MQELQQKIDIILNEERRAYAANGRRGGHLGSFNISVGDGYTDAYPKAGNYPKLLIIPASLNSISSPQAEIMLKLYSSLKSDEKEQFKGILLSYLSKDGQFFDVGSATVVRVTDDQPVRLTMLAPCIANFLSQSKYVRISLTIS